MKKINVLVLILTAISIGVLIKFYNELPDMVPRKWGFDGEIKGYMEKSQLFILSLLPVMLLVVFNIVPKIDPKKDNYKKHESSYHGIVLVTSLFFIAFSNLSLFISLNKIINISQVVSIMMGILFIVIGNLMPRFRHNYTIGIRTPWTLANDKVWLKTHRLGGILFVLAGIVSVVVSFIIGKVALTVSFIIIMSSVFLVTLYSYFSYKKEATKN